jgi:hypothetical protein
MSPDNVQIETFCELSLVDGRCITLDQSAQFPLSVSAFFKPPPLPCPSFQVRRQKPNFKLAHCHNRAPDRPLRDKLLRFWPPDCGTIVIGVAQHEDRVGWSSHGELHCT